jgi:hypothetical protein
MMYDGSIKKVEDILVGDRVCGWNPWKGTDEAHKVIQLHRGRDWMYRIVPLLGHKKPFIVNGGHILTVVNKDESDWNLYDASVHLWSKIGIDNFRLARSVGDFDGSRYLKVPFYIEPVNTIDNYYGFTLKEGPYYLLNDTTITHNSGKSIIAMSLSHSVPGLEQQVIALTESRNLQRQYQRLFRDCHAHYGRSNYKCIHPKYVPWGLTVERCPFQPKMNQCPYYKACPYITSKHHAIASQRTALNYAYWLVANRHFDPQWLVYDEAHMLSDIVLGYVGTSISQRAVDKWQLPPIPEIADASFALFGGKLERPEEIVIEWLSECCSIVDEAITPMREKYTTDPDDDLAHELDAAENLAYKMAATIESISTGDKNSHWYIRAGADAGYYHGAS